MKNLRIFLIIIFALSPITYHPSPIFAQHEAHQDGPGRVLSQSKDEGHTTQAPAKQEKNVGKQLKQKDVYYCPMHPTYTSDRPGDCPICNMKLVKKKQAEETEKKSDLSTVNISLEKQQLIGVKTAKAAYKPFTRTLRTVGRVAFDPELYKTEQEYVEALKTYDKVKTSGAQTIIGRSASLVDAAKLKLELSGLSNEQINEIAEIKESDQSLLISSEKSPIAWVYATIYEYELEYVKIGQVSTIKAQAYPAIEFKGVVVSIDPVFETMTRSVRARIKTENTNALLKPNMFVDVEMFSDLGVKLAVPREAIMDTGIRKIAFVSLGDGRMQNRNVLTGISSDDYVEIVEGVKDGESVVTSGNFLIDSESKLKSALEGTAHQHGQ